MVNGRGVERVNYTTSSDNLEFPQPRTRMREDLSGMRSWRWDARSAYDLNQSKRASEADSLDLPVSGCLVGRQASGVHTLRSADSCWRAAVSRRNEDRGGDAPVIFGAKVTVWEDHDYIIAAFSGARP